MRGKFRYSFALKALVVLCCLALSSKCAYASTETVREQEPATYKIATAAAEKLFVKQTSSSNKLLSNMTVGVAQGMDSNPLLDATKKADSYTEENIDVRFRYPLGSKSTLPVESKFGFAATNVNYYRVTDVNILDMTAFASFESEFCNNFLLSAGYGFELLTFPNDENGNYVGNQMNLSIKQRINNNLYHKFSYKLIYRDYLERKVLLSNGVTGSDLRADMRNSLEEEIGVYIGRNTKLRLINQYYMNQSNFQYLNYYDYYVYRTGLQATRILNDKLYNITGFYYQYKRYYSRTVSNGDARERDNLYVISTSFLYDLTKHMSFYINYSYRENHTNEPLEKYSDSVYSGGMFYAF